MESVKNLKHINCPSCNSLKITKDLMSPNVLNSKDKIVTISKSKKFSKIKSKIKKYQKFIKKNFNYVGDNFAYEARSIHYNGKKKQKVVFHGYLILLMAPDHLLLIAQLGAI